MNIQHYWNFFLKRTLRKKSVWIPLILYLFVFLIKFLLLPNLPPLEPIQSVNVFFHNTFLIQKDFFTNWFVFPYLLSWIFWYRFDDIGKETQKDGTDLFLLSTAIPTNRKKIFFGKVFFLTSFLTGLHLVINLLDFALFWKTGIFVGFTGLNFLLIIFVNIFLATLLFFLPLFIFLFSLASLKSIWYTILRWSGIIIFLFVPIMVQIVNNLAGKKWLSEWYEKVKELSAELSNNYLWVNLAIIGITILLSSITLRLAYKDYQKKDLS